jgi:glycosyltransferase involved in cell wall biosynthesis
MAAKSLDTPTLSVVIPALNEEDGIAAIVERVLAVEDAMRAVGIGRLELIVVDDGSRDATPSIVEGYVRSHPNTVRLIRHARNRGYGGALKTGFRHAQGDLLAFLDADGTYPPESFPELCRVALEDGADVIVGSRMSGRESEMPRVRWLGNGLFALLLSLVGNARIRDTASGMRVFRRDVLPHLYPLPDGLDFTPAMSTRALHENLVMVEVPIPYRERVGRSKLSVIRDGFRFLHSIVWTALTYNPVRIFGMAGFALALLGALIALISLALRQDGAWPFPRFFAALVLVVAGVNLFSVGTLFNDLVSLFHKRHIRQGLFGRPLFQHPLERDFWWLGGLSGLAGLVIYLLAVRYDWTGPTSAAPWFAPAVSALLVLTGLQLICSWFLARILSELSQRELSAANDLNGE